MRSNEKEKKKNNKKQTTGTNIWEQISITDTEL